MTDPLRRDPREFLRTLKMMAGRSSWQKAMIFASKGRMVGFELGVDHYNTVLFSQALWGRALEIVRVVRAMEEDDVRPNGVSYYYMVHGMANADHGFDKTLFNANHQLPQLQHWRVAINALQASRHNGYDPPDTMFSSAMVTCTIPVVNQWRQALGILNTIIDEERVPNKQSLKFLEDCLIRNKRIVEATRVRNWAATAGIAGYEGKAEPDVFQHLPDFGKAADAAADAAGETPSAAVADADDAETAEALRREEAVQRPGGKVHAHAASVFRPRVYRQLWWEWHSVANKYRPQDVLKKKQLSPRSSPTGVVAWNRM